ncbi:MAG: iron ABC transporter permease [Phycisphaerae bacterium]|jgi:iron complex transport system permease protein
MPRRGVQCLLVLLLLLLGAFLWRVYATGHPEPAGTDLWWLRVHRSVAAIIVGASLALAGLHLQCLLRNPLASSDLLGLASGSGLAVLVAVYLGWLAAPGVMAAGLAMPVVALAALAGAFATLGLTFLLSRRRGVLDPVQLVLTGLAVGIICSAGIMLLRHLLPYQHANAADRLLLGAIRDDLRPLELTVVGGITLVAAIATWRLGPAMDIASLSDDEATSLGVDLPAVRRWMFLWAGTLTAGSVLLAGPIGFVGLVCPHLMRLVCGPAHRPLSPNAALAGAVLVLAGDALVRTVELPSGRLPLGVVTALVGGPIFIWLLRRGMSPR